MSNYCCDQLHCLIGKKVIVYSCRSKCLVVVCDICPSYMKAIEVGNGSTKIFNLERIDYIEEICC